MNTSSREAPDNLDSAHNLQREKRLRATWPALPQSTVLLFLLTLRLINALSIQTFFQPDEYFQSLEPAWALALGSQSGAWITWVELSPFTYIMVPVLKLVQEWRHRLRSSLHPALFAALYALCAQVKPFFSQEQYANLLLAAPKVGQGVIAAVGDFYTWKLAERIYGEKSATAWTTLALSVFSPWQWFCSTRTLSNCLEMTLTVAALYFWPFSHSPPSEAADEPSNSSNAARTNDGLQWCLYLAALACILRPTNVIIWASLSMFFVLKSRPRDLIYFARQIFLCGSVVIVLAALADRQYYQTWTLPPFRFVYFNLAQSLAIFYGVNPWHYYLSQGVPLLLTTAVPFGVWGLWTTLSGRGRGTREKTSPRSPESEIPFELAVTTILTIMVMSLISHKEVRFIYPLLPILHLMAALPLTQLIYGPLIASRGKVSYAPRVSLRKKIILAVVLLLNILAAGYLTRVHQSGVILVMDYLRGEYEQATKMQSDAGAQMTVSFLMPCHSTPWRSHLLYPEIQAWALGCEPPVNLSEPERKVYLDDADIFYGDVDTVLRARFAPLQAPPNFSKRLHNPESDLGPETTPESIWPEYLVFFEHLEDTLTRVLVDEMQLGYEECWRRFNSHAHDDGRRKGDVIVWCRSRRGPSISAGRIN